MGKVPCLEIQIFSEAGSPSTEEIQWRLGTIRGSCGAIRRIGSSSDWSVNWDTTSVMMDLSNIRESCEW